MRNFDDENGWSCGPREMVKIEGECHERCLVADEACLLFELFLKNWKKSRNCRRKITQFTTEPNVHLENTG